MHTTVRFIVWVVETHVGSVCPCEQSVVQYLSLNHEHWYIEDEAVRTKAEAAFWLLNSMPMDRLPKARAHGASCAAA